MQNSKEKIKLFLISGLFLPSYSFAFSKAGAQDLLKEFPFGFKTVRIAFDAPFPSHSFPVQSGYA